MRFGKVLNNMRTKPHRAWIMMLVCCVMMASLALCTTCLSLFTQPVSEAMHFSRAAFTAYISTAGIFTAFAMPAWGWLLPRMGMKPVVCISGLVVTICFILLSRADNLWQFYTAGTIFGFFSPAYTIFPVAIVINNWFVEKRGFAMGIAVAFSGVGVAIFSPLIACIIAAQDWQTAYVVIGVATFFLTVPVGFFLLKESPIHVGLLPFGAVESGASRQSGQEAVTLPGVPFETVKKSRAFYGVCVSMFLSSLAIVGLIQHIPALMVSKGLSEAMAGNAMSVFAIALLVAKVGMGWLNDRVGTQVAVLVCFAAGMVGIFLLMRVGGSTIPIAQLSVIACGITVSTVWPSLVTERMFGQRSFARTFVFIQGSSTLGYGLGAPLYGLSYDKTGLYDPMMFIGIGIVAVAGIVITMSIKDADRNSNLRF